MQTGHMPPLSPVYPLVKLWFDDEHYGTRRFYLFSLARVPTLYRLHWNPPSPPET